MATFLFDEIIFGPVKSRRLGISLGINLLPTDTKVCSFDCIYCECGWTPKKRERKAVLPAREHVAEKLREKLTTMQQSGVLPDVITFAGNGEPTLHPKFPDIIDDTISLRNRFAPDCRIAVLSNATMIHRKPVFQALLRIEDNIQKLDSAIKETIERIDCPLGRFDLQQVIQQLKRFGNRTIIQTLFLRGTHKNETIDNTTEEELGAWLEALKVIQPGQVMIYSIDRDTPAQGLLKVPVKELNQIAARVREAGFEVQVSG